MKLLGITLLSAQAISLDRQEASQFLSRRQRRETGESRDDLELECIEKRCSAEELDEVYDFETGLWKDPANDHGYPYKQAYKCWVYSLPFDQKNTCERKTKFRECLGQTQVQEPEFENGDELSLEQAAQDEQTHQINTVTEKLPPKPSAASKRPVPTQKPTDKVTTYTLTETAAHTTTDLYDSYDTVTEIRGDN